MLNINKLFARYKQFGGFRLVREYTKLGVLWPAIKAGVRCLVKRQSIKAIYPEVLRKTEPYLMERYAPILRSKMSDVRGKTLEHEHPKVIWWCWLQGIENAPSIVKACFNSLKRLTGYSLVVIDNSNWREYVELPEYIVKKWEKKQIPPALFSDLVRLELLIKYGGTWIDSTVLCTGNVNDNDNYLDADLFLFQYTKQGCIPVNISNWFISACSNNEVLMVLREMLYAYWKDYDCVLDYYIFHLFFAMISKEYLVQIAAMPYGQSQNSLVLLHHWGEKFDQMKWDKLTNQVCFHKLAFRTKDSVKATRNNYYNYILNTYNG